MHITPYAGLGYGYVVPEHEHWHEHEPANTEVVTDSDLTTTAHTGLAFNLHRTYQILVRCVGK